MSIVVPLHRTSATVGELLRRLEAVVPDGTEVVLVEDACPEGSGDEALGAGSLPGVLLRLDRNVGQHAAVEIGLRAADGARVVVMDGDLQDRPEDVPELLAALYAAEPSVTAIAAGRRGTYTTAVRARTARLHRRVMHRLSRRRIPPDAGMFLAMTAATRDRVLGLDDPRAPLVPALARVGAEVQSIPLDRQTRPQGRSSYRRFARFGVAWRSIMTVSPLYPLARAYRRRVWVEPDVTVVTVGSGRRPDAVPASVPRPGRSRSAHNADQVDYFTGRDLPRMDARTRSSTPYTLRQLDAVIRVAGLRRGERVLDVGCGLGKYTVGLAERGIDVEGLDLTPALVEELRRYAPDMPTHVADIAEPPAGLLGRFDAVTGFFFLHHVPDLTAIFAGVRQVLRPGGRAAFLEPNPLFPGYYVQVAFTPGMSWRHERGISRMRAGVLADAARAAGFEGFAVERFGAFPPVLANRPAGRRVEAALESIPGWEPARAFQLFTLSAA